LTSGSATFRVAGPASSLTAWTIASVSLARCGSRSPGATAARERACAVAGSLLALCASASSSRWGVSLSRERRRVASSLVRRALPSH
jgi:hypothetical protein